MKQKHLKDRENSGKKMAKKTSINYLEKRIKKKTRKISQKKNIKI